MVTHKVQSPAKVNLMLRILGQRTDGYHDLQTIFQILDWGDEMEFTKLSNKGNHDISIEGFSGLSDEDNLIYRAAQLLKPFAHCASDWLVKVKKQIPQGAGLGGGSSNAAQTLKFLNQHWSCGLTHEQLIKIGGELGADIPIFIREKSALATGTGNHISHMTFKTPYLLLVFPNIGVSTAEMFRHKSLTTDQAELPLQYIQQQQFWINDFFPLLLLINSEIATLYQKLKVIAPFRLSGTGSTMFAVFNTQQDAETVQKALQHVVQSVVVRPKN